jgi:hypothetical protein
MQEQKVLGDQTHHPGLPTELGRPYFLRTIILLISEIAAFSTTFVTPV